MLTVKMCILNSTDSQSVAKCSSTYRLSFLSFVWIKNINTFNIYFVYCKFWCPNLLQPPTFSVRNIDHDGSLCECTHQHSRIVFPLILFRTTHCMFTVQCSSTSTSTHTHTHFLLARGCFHILCVCGVHVSMSII